jgi:uncharacterized DUF497 family protein
MRFEWDAKKDRLNQRKHDGIDFALASLVFEDPYCVLYPDRIDLETGEQRWHALGSASIEPGFKILLLVVHVYREDENYGDKIRIISARPADKRDIGRYQEQEMD